ncbi:MAG: hypothetical protein LLF83_06525 [Methanobacterium sp.]|nr:hypothetical protein [Methanobacterium sp.]
MADKKQVTLTLSFRDDELWIYEEICRHSAKGGWVKDVLADHIRGQTTLRTKEKVVNQLEEEKPNISGLFKF